MYMLNLVFDLTKADADGLFEEYSKRNDDGTDRAVLERSLCWLKLLGNQPADPIDAGFVPEKENWDDLEHPAAVLLRKQRNPGWICIRAVPKPGTPQPKDLQLVAAFGRPARYGQPQASPFTNDGQETGRIKTTFVFGPGPDPLNSWAKKGGSWLYKLGTIAKKGPKENSTHRYEFAVGLIVNPGGNEYHFGEDPEMDIEM